MSSPNIIRMIKLRRMKWAGHVARMGRRGMHMGYWWEESIRMDLGEMGWGGMDWMDLAQNRDQWRALVNMVMNLRVP
jgi:hypothetical protein